MKSDSQIQMDVMSELKWDTAVTHEHIGVAVRGGIVTLTGMVPSYVEKRAAERAAQRVAGVRAVVEKIDVKLLESDYRDDQNIADAVLSAFQWSVQVPDQMLRVAVSNGWVTLSGEVDWEYQKSAAEDAARVLTGVKGIFNQISIKSRVQPSDVKEEIEQALKRAVEREAERIDIAVHGGRVVLTGVVRSFADLRDVRGAAWNAPGVIEVEDHLTVAA